MKFYINKSFIIFDHFQYNFLISFTPSCHNPDMQQQPILPTDKKKQQSHPQSSQLSRLQNITSQQIKKSKLKYLECPKKGLHQSQLLTLVCVDQKCKNKGLLCPVCRDVEHQDHQTMHIKSFLAELHNRIIKKQQNNNGNNQQDLLMKNDLSSKLLVLEASKDNMIQSLKESVKTLATAVKQLQNKIINTYTQVRRLILSQTSIGNKLPNLVKILAQSKDNTSQTQLAYNDLQDQIKKYTQLMEVKNNKVYIADDSNAITQEYKKVSDTFITHLMGIMTELPKKIKELPLKMKSLQKMSKQKQTNDVKIQSIFSQNHKAPGIQLQEANKKASIKADIGLGGVVFVNQKNQKSDENEKKVSFKICGSVSDSICVGLASVDYIQGQNYFLQQMGQTSGNVFGICAMGLNLSDIQCPSFVFSGGDIIDMSLDIQFKVLKINRRNSIEQEQITLGIKDQQLKKMQFFASLIVPGDIIEIIQ